MKFPATRYPRVIDPLWMFHEFQRIYKHIRMPTNTGWTWSWVNGAGGFDPGYLNMYTSVTASSRALYYAETHGMNSGSIGHHYIDWTKRIELSFIISRADSDAEVIARIQLKEIATEGVLAAKGIGIQVSNLTVVGEAYGTALQTTGTLKTLTSARCIRVKIVKMDTSVEFWIDGVLVGSLTGTAVPNVAGGAVGNLVLSIINGVTGGVDAVLRVSNIEMVQAW